MRPNPIDFDKVLLKLGGFLALYSHAYCRQKTFQAYCRLGFLIFHGFILLL